MIYYFFGKDWFLTKLAADKKSSELVAEGFKKAVLENLADLKNATKANSLFSAPKGRDLSPRLRVGAGASGGGERQCFSVFFDKLKEAEKAEFKKLNFPEDQVFIFAEKSTTPSLLFGRTKVEKLKTNEVDEKWLKAQAKEFNIEIDKTLTNYLLNQDLKSYDAGYFYYELLKLSLYKPGEKVNLADLMKISESPEELNYFEWVKAVLESQTAKALKHVPENEYEALGRLKSLINIFELILVSEGEVSPADKEKFLSKNSPFWVKNIRQWAGKMSYQQKLAALEILLDSEIKVKTGRLSSIEALKLFVIG